MTEKTTRWFLEPLNDFTNEVVYAYFSDTGRSSDDSIKSSFPDQYGVLHHVLEMPSFREVNRLINAKNISGIKLRVFRLKDGSRHIEEFAFAYQNGKVKKSGAYRKAVKDVSGLRKCR